MAGPYAEGFMVGPHPGSSYILILPLLPGGGVLLKYFSGRVWVCMRQLPEGNGQDSRLLSEAFYNSPLD